MAQSDYSSHSLDQGCRRTTSVPGCLESRCSFGCPINIVFRSLSAYIIDGQLLALVVLHTNSITSPPHGQWSPSATPFPAEPVQLTDGVLADVTDAIQNDTVSSIFTFTSTDSSSISKRSLHRCKVMPGDRDWPCDLIWEIFSLLLGNRLVKTTPLAAYCYPDWPEYDAGKCASITAQWLSSDLQ